MKVKCSFVEREREREKEWGEERGRERETEMDGGKQGLKRKGRKAFHRNEWASILMLSMRGRRREVGSDPERESKLCP